MSKPMRKLVIAVSQDGRQTSELCFRFEPEPGEDPFDSFGRLRAAVFLTGVAIERAKVVERDHEWIAPPDLLRTVNGVLRAGQRRNDPVVASSFWLRIPSSAVH
jgi:hypothetical protein